MNSQIEKVIYSAKEKKYYIFLSYKKIRIESQISEPLAQTILKKGIKKITSTNASPYEVNYFL